MTSMNIHFQSKQATVSFDEEEGFVRLKIDAFLGAEGIKELFTETMQYFKTLGISKILNDFRGFQGSSPAAQKWVLDNYYPAMKSYGLVHVATVVSSSVFAAHTVNNVQNQLTQDFEYKTFGDIDEAEEWLEAQVSYTYGSSVFSKV